MICFSIINDASFKNVRAKWCGEVVHYCPTAKVLLVGTKCDLREKEKNVNIISMSQGEQMSRDISAVAYIECSALTREGLKQVFDAAIKAVLVPQTRFRNDKKCKIM